jgi:hypothetical protein
MEDKKSRLAALEEKVAALLAENISLRKQMAELKQSQTVVHNHYYSYYPYGYQQWGSPGLMPIICGTDITGTIGTSTNPLTTTFTTGQFSST